MIKAKEMLSITHRAQKVNTYCQQVLIHAETYAKQGYSRSSTMLHEDEFPNINNSLADDMKKVFKSIGYSVYIEIYENEYSTNEGYLGEIKLFWDDANK